MIYKLLLAGLCIIWIAPRANAEPLHVLVPAYANPGFGDGPLMWSSLIATASDPLRNFELHVIFNPASGPGVARDPNYLDPSDHGPLAELRAAGAVIHGYVATGLGSRSIAVVQSDVDAYLTGFYAGFVDGIFFDEMSNDLANVGYYETLHAYVQGVIPGAHTFGNPGTTFVNNPTAQSTWDATDWVNSLDTIITFENTENEYLTNYTSFPYLEGLDPDKIGHILHTAPTWSPGLLPLAQSRGAGYLYVTDDVMPNPYDALSSYWGEMTADLSAANAVPEPMSCVLLLAGLAGFTCFGKRARRSV